MRSIHDSIKAGRLNKYECVQPMKGKYVGVIIPNKFENLIICELEAFQITGTLNNFSPPQKSSILALYYTEVLDPFFKDLRLNSSSIK